MADNFPLIKTVCVDPDSNVRQYAVFVYWRHGGETRAPFQGTAQDAAKWRKLLQRIAEDARG